MITIIKYSNEDKKYTQIGNLISHHRYSKALLEANKAAIKYPKSVIALSLKGNILAKLKDYKAALAIYENALRLDPVVNTGLKLNSVILYKKGIMLEKLHQYRDANECYGKYMKLPDKIPKIVADIKKRRRKNEKM